MMLRCMALASLMFITVASAAAGDYAIIVRSAEIAPKKDNGLDWDFGSPPDAYVLGGVRVGQGQAENTGRSSVAKDTLQPFWNEQVTSADRNDEVILSVQDKDLSSDDGIGETAFTLTRSIIDEGGVELSFGGVLRLQVIVEEQ